MSEKPKLFESNLMILGSLSRGVISHVNFFTFFKPV